MSDRHAVTRPLNGVSLVNVQVNDKLKVRLGEAGQMVARSIKPVAIEPAPDGRSLWVRDEHGSEEDPAAGHFGDYGPDSRSGPVELGEGIELLLPRGIELQVHGATEVDINPLTRLRLIFMDNRPPSLPRAQGLRFDPGPPRQRL